MGRIKQRESEQKGPGGIMKAVKHTILVLTIIASALSVQAEDNANAQDSKTEAGTNMICEECLRNDPKTALGKKSLIILGKTWLLTMKS